jgi:TonB family protein
MRTLQFWILAYLLNSLWQVPLLFAAAWLAARMARSLGAGVEHRVWVIALWLQGLVPAASLFPWPGAFSLLGSGAGGAGQPHVSVVVGSGSSAGVLPLPGVLLTAIAISYVGLTAYFAARFLWRTSALSALRREATAVVLTGEPASFWARCLRMFGVDDVSIAASSRVFGPVTMGVRRKLLLLPVSMVDVLPDRDLETVIAHEFAHMHRKDFMKNLVYELLSLPVMYNPLLWLTRARIMESREMVCDQMAAAMTGEMEYAHSLLRLASLLVAGTLGRTPHTIGIFDANAFERRLMNVAEKHERIQGAGRTATVVACVALAVATCGSALTFGMRVDAAPVGNDSTATKAPKQLSVSSDVMQGNLINKTIPVYPPEAKKAKIEGTVVLSAVIGKDGTVENLRVLSGPKELQQSALDAVRMWKYKPFLLNGDPIEVKTTVNIVYNLKG